MGRSLGVTGQAKESRQESVLVAKMKMKASRGLVVKLGEQKTRGLLGATSCVPSRRKCLHFALSNPRSCFSRSLPSGGPLPNPCHISSLTTWHPTPNATGAPPSPSQHISLRECCSSSHPLALPGSVAVTWPFSRSLSAAPASPPQSNDAIAATAASGPSTCDSHRREAARGPTQRPMGFPPAGRGWGLGESHHPQRAGALAAGRWEESGAEGVVRGGAGGR